MVCDLLTKFLKDCYLPCKEALQNHIDSEDIVTKQKGKGGGGRIKQKIKNKDCKNSGHKNKNSRKTENSLENLRGASNRKGICYFPCLHGIR